VIESGCKHLARVVVRESSWSQLWSVRYSADLLNALGGVAFEHRDTISQRRLTSFWLILHNFAVMMILKIVTLSKTKSSCPLPFVELAGVYLLL